jgi:protein TFG
LVTVFDSQDLSFALQTSRVLKLQVFMNNQERSKASLNSEGLQKQLREIRDAVTWLLDTMDINEGNNMSNPIRNNNLHKIKSFAITMCLPIHLFY